MDKPVAEERTLQLLAEKAASMGEDLTMWAHEQLLLGIGHRVHIIIQIREEIAVDIETARTFDKVFDRVPNDADWDELFALPWNTRKEQHRGRGLQTASMLEMLQELRQNGNNARNGVSKFVMPHFNAFFKSRGDKFRLVGMGRGLYVLRVAR
jgi:hypothetical protein